MLYPEQYVAHRALVPPVIDGVVEGDPAWEGIAWTSDFVDIGAGPKPRLRTRAKVRWDESFLYFAAHLEEPDVFANVTSHDDVVFRDNDFEVFVDLDGSTHAYKETELNAIGVTWDLFLAKSYMDGGHEDSRRVDPQHGFEMFPPARAATKVVGPVNDPRVRNGGWTAELALPLSSLSLNTTAELPPKPGQFYRLNFSRVEWRVKDVDGHYEKDPKYKHEDNWVWSRQGEIQVHLPERWGVLQLADDRVNATPPSLYPNWDARAVAVAVFCSTRSTRCTPLSGGMPATVGTASRSTSRRARAPATAGTPINRRGGAPRHRRGTADGR